MSSSLQLVVLFHCQSRDCLSSSNTEVVLLLSSLPRAWCCQEVGTGRTPPAIPQRKCSCQEAFANVSFSAAAGGKFTGTLATGEARGGTRFSHTSSCPFLCLPVWVFSLPIQEIWLKLPCGELQGASGCPSSQLPCRCQPGCAEPEPMHLLSPEVSQGSQGMGTTCAFCEMSRPLAP